MIRNLMILSAIYLAILAGTDFLAQPAQAQTPGVWQVNGPEFNAEITGIIVDPDDYRRIHVGTRGRVNVVNPGLFRTLNGGISWSIAPAPVWTPQASGQRCAAGRSSATGTTLVAAATACVANDD